LIVAHKGQQSAALLIAGPVIGRIRKNFVDLIIGFAESLEIPIDALI
jgi:hypothetical protein